jgi:hypothetical protein
MKIALCIAGQPRNLVRNVPYLIENLIKPNNISDIFIHTWYDKSLDGSPFDSAQPHLDNRLGTYLPESDLFLIKNLNPKKIECELPKNFDEFSNLNNLPTAIQKRLASNFYSVWKCNQLKKEYETEHNFVYDVVIKTRVDLEYYGHVEIDKLVDKFNPNTAYVPRIYQEMRQTDSYPISSGGFYSSLSDTFAFGDSDSIDKFCSVYPNFSKIYQEIYPFVYGEAYLGFQARHVHKLTIEMRDINYKISR